MSPAFFRFGRGLTGFIARILYHVEYDGTENLPAGGGYIVVSNHRTNFDPILIAQRIKPTMRFMAKIELFHNKLFGAILLGLGAFPVERGKGDSSTLDFAIDTLKKGDVLAMFPEGTRSKDGTPLKPKSGTAMIASKAQVMVLPVGIYFGKELKFRNKVLIRYGKPIPYEALGFTGTVSPSEMKHASKFIMEEITKLLHE